MAQEKIWQKHQGLGFAVLMVGGLVLTVALLLSAGTGPSQAKACHMDLTEPAPQHCTT